MADIKFLHPPTLSGRGKYSWPFKSSDNYTYLGIEYKLICIFKDNTNDEAISKEFNYCYEWNDNILSQTLPQYLIYKPHETIKKIKNNGGVLYNTFDYKIFIPFHNIIRIEVRDIQKYYRNGLNDKTLGPKIYVKEWPELIWI